MKRPYQEMAERAVRSYCKIPEPGYPNATPEEVWDAYLCFFTIVYHLKDWIENDKELGISQEKINSFIEKNENMKLLQTVVTKFKHLNANRNHIAFKISLSWDDGSPKPSPEIGYEKRDFVQTKEGSLLLSEKESESSQKNMHPRKLALKVLVAWNIFFKENNLEGGFVIENN